jgi:hypothetical protein
VAKLVATVISKLAKEWPTHSNPPKKHKQKKEIAQSYMPGTPTKRQVSKRPVSKRLKRQVYKTSALQNVRLCQVYKMSGLQNVRSSKRPVAKKHPYIFCTCGWWKSAGSVAAMFAGKVMAVFYSLF